MGSGGGRVVVVVVVDVVVVELVVTAVKATPWGLVPSTQAVRAMADSATVAANFRRDERGEDWGAMRDL